MNREKIKAYAAEYGLEPSNMALERFELLEQRLIRWNEHINLTAITDEDGIAVKHIADSLSVFKAVDPPQGARVIDVGCGAGFPGLPMLIMRPDLDMTFLDSVGKKLGFTKEVLRLAGLMGEVVSERAETLAHISGCRESFDLAVSRAVAPLNILAEYCLGLVKLGGLFAALKGSEDETALAARAVEEMGGRIRETVYLKLPNGDERNIVVVEKISQTPPKYPRKTKKITTRPL